MVYFHMIAGVQGITPDHVWTCFKALRKWRLPSDMNNQLRLVSIRNGWLDTSDTALLGKIVELNVIYNMWATHGPDLKNEYERTKQLGKEIDALLQDVKDQMRKELSVGASGYDTPPDQRPA